MGRCLRLLMLTMTAPVLILPVGCGSSAKDSKPNPEFTVPNTTAKGKDGGKGSPTAAPKK